MRHLQPALWGGAGCFQGATERSGIDRAKGDAALLDLSMARLAHLYRTAIPQPEALRTTRWGLDPFSLGSYTYNALGGTEHTRDQLAQPVAGQLFFAGEATHRQGFGTVHGAYLSGQRAARQVMESIPG
jgi:monoamine oxidase